MTKEQLQQEYINNLSSRAREYAISTLAGDKGFMPPDIYEDTLTLIYNSYLSGANTARELIIKFMSDYKNI